MSIPTDVLTTLEHQSIELPSWAFGNSGTRFKVFATPGTPRTIEEKLADAAQVNALTGLAPSVALHIPWDKVDDYAALADYAAGLGVRLGTINSNTFQDDDYKFGSLTHSDPAVRRKAVDHMYECLEVMNMTGSQDLKIWLADGTNYPGQGNLRARQDWLAESLRKVYDRLGEDQRMVLEYKFFEPAFYHTDVPDWGTSYVHCAALGEKAKVCLDTGHHAPGTNIEFIVAQLLRLGKLGSFDFNSRFYADDDLIVGAADPFQLFRIMHEVVRGGGLGAGRRGGVHAGPVPQHRGEDPRPDPFRAQRPGNDGAGPARGHRRPRGRTARRRCPRRQRGPDGRLLHRRPPRTGGMARIPGPARRPAGSLRRQRIPGKDQCRPPGRPPGRMGSLRP